ncbi:MAG TPA: metallophosphoesterase [Pyrinomonadaceae bacterium]|jgi:hypothetical protein
MRLATFVHISDLHFGHLDPVSLNAQAPGLWAKHSGFDGLLGHSYNSLRKLADCFLQMRKDEDARLIVTGDLTTVGHPDQFDMAKMFLGGKLVFPKGSPIGLMATDWSERGVAGNHDHWPGHAGIWGGPTGGLISTFPTMPYVNDPPLQLGKSHVLRFMGIDTDADVNPKGTDRFLARGSFTSDLTKLENELNLLPLPAENEIRVLCLHHSQELNSINPALQMDAVSRDALHDFIIDRDIAVLLCGHVHTPPVVKFFNITHRTQQMSGSFLEARCATTTQTSTLPYSWRTILGNRPRRIKRMPNSLLVHRLSLEDGKIYWETDLYSEMPKGFKKVASPPPNIIVDNHVKVWPRP